MSKAILGIDPGSKGFLSLYNGQKWYYYAISDYDLNGLSKIIKDCKALYPDMICIIEEIHAVFGSSAKATFSFGETFGKLQALIIAHNIPLHYVQPKEWQKEMWSNKDLVVNYKKVVIKGKETTRKEVDTKATSYNAARRLFPDIDFRKSERCKSFDDNKVDATLIAEYARRKNI